MSAISDISVNPDDSLGKTIRILTAVIAVLLSIFTIVAHRSHSQALELQKEVNDHWAHYQAKRIRDYQLELNSDLLAVVAAQNTASENLKASYAKQHLQYSSELSELKHEAIETSKATSVKQRKALCFDLVVVILEISLVMCSLYFISNRKLFPIFGLCAGVFAVLAGVWGWML